jgi:hypothetical protein
MKKQSLETQLSSLRRYVGLRLNVFRALHDKHFFVADDRSVLATRIGDFALTVCLGFDHVFTYYYVKDCNWYRSDLTRLGDDDVPEQIRYELLRHFRSVLG